MILFLISALIAGDFGVFKTMDTSGNFILLVLLGGLAQSLIYIFYYRNLKRFPVWEVKLFLLLIPIVSCIVGVIAFGEEIVALQIAGAGLVLLGASIILLRNKINVRVIGNN